MKAERAVLASIFVFSVLVVSGCTGQGESDVTGVVEGLPQVQQFLEENPEADISVVRLNSDYLQENEDEIPEDCVPAIDPEQAHYKATVTEKEQEMEIWLRAEDREVMCALREGKEVEDEGKDEDRKIVQKGCPNQPVVVEGNDWEYSKGKLKLMARNNAGEEITLTEVTVEDEETSVSLNKTLGTAEHSDTITIHGLSEIEEDDEVDFEIIFTYDGLLENQTSTCELEGKEVKDDEDEDDEKDEDKEREIGDGVVINSFETVPSEVFSGDKFELFVDVRNLGDVEAKDINPELYTAGGASSQGFSSENTIESLNPPTDGSEGEKATFTLDMTAPDLDITDETVTPEVRVRYKYSTEARVFIPVLRKEEHRAMVEAGETIPGIQKPKVTKGPLTVGITGPDPALVEEGDKNFTFTVQGKNVGSGTAYQSGGHPDPEREHINEIGIDIEPGDGLNLDDCDEDSVTLRGGDSFQIVCSAEVKNTEQAFQEIPVELTLDYGYRVGKKTSVQVQEEKNGQVEEEPIDCAIVSVDIDEETWDGENVTVYVHGSQLTELGVTIEDGDGDTAFTNHTPDNDYYEPGRSYRLIDNNLPEGTVDALTVTAPDCAGIDDSMKVEEEVGDIVEEASGYVSVENYVCDDTDDSVDKLYIRNSNPADNYEDVSLYLDGQYVESITIPDKEDGDWPYDIVQNNTNSDLHADSLQTLSDNGNLIGSLEFNYNGEVIESVQLVC